MPGKGLEAEVPSTHHVKGIAAAGTVGDRLRKSLWINLKRAGKFEKGRCCPKVSGEEKIVQRLRGLPGAEWSEVKNRIAKRAEHREHACKLFTSSSHHDE